jgi:hypothetical protein
MNPFEGRELPYSAFDRLGQIRHADIVNKVLLPLCTSLIDPLSGQTPCLGFDSAGALAADFHTGLKREILNSG